MVDVRSTAFRRADRSDPRKRGTPNGGRARSGRAGGVYRSCHCELQRGNLLLGPPAWYSKQRSTQGVEISSCPTRSYASMRRKCSGHLKLSLTSRARPVSSPLCLSPTASPHWEFVFHIRLYIAHQLDQAVNVHERQILSLGGPSFSCSAEV